MPSALSTFISNRLNEKKIYIPKKLKRAVIEELERAIEPPLHEGALQAYGSIITFLGDSLIRTRVRGKYNSREHRLSSNNIYLNAADGSRSFFCRYIDASSSEDEVQSLWISDGIDFSSEAALFSLRDYAVYESQQKKVHSKGPILEFIIVQRNREGDVRLLSSSGILKLTRGIWKRSLYQYDYNLDDLVPKLSPSLVQDPPIDDVFRRMLRLSVHILGAQGIGATLLIESHDGEFDSCNNIDSKVSWDLREINLSINNKADQELIAHLLAHHDGAAIFSSTGNLLSVKNWISSAFRDDDSLQDIGGTRQLSAITASRYSTLPVITVSSDGPVRAYYQGKMICDGQIK
jgi:hypothetical protein